MLRKNFISELPFDDETNKVILNCTNCEDHTPLTIVGKKTFVRLRKRGGKNCVGFLICSSCKNRCSHVEKILEGFACLSKRFGLPMFDPSLDGKNKFVYQGLDIASYVVRLNYFYDNDDLENFKLWVLRLNFEQAKGMFYLNLHFWRHFESCFKYRKNLAKDKQSCRYCIPAWPVICLHFLSFEIEENQILKSLHFSTMQRPPYIFMAESVQRLMLTYFANHCVKLVKTPNLFWYWKGYSTKVMKENRVSVANILRKTKQELKERLDNSRKPGAKAQTEYQLGLGFFGKSSFNFVKKTVVACTMAGYCLSEGDCFHFGT